MLFRSECIFSPDEVSQRFPRQQAAVVDEYLANALFLLAEHRAYQPDEVVSLCQRPHDSEVVVRSVFEEVDCGALDAAAMAAAAAEASSAASSGGSAATGGGGSGGGGRGSADAGASALMLRTYVMETAKGETINHVRVCAGRLLSLSSPLVAKSLSTIHLRCRHRWCSSASHHPSSVYYWWLDPC